jgi:hypothetical protein
MRINQRYGIVIAGVIALAIFSILGLTHSVALASVEVVGFRATGSEDDIAIEWETESESGTLSFIVWRTEEQFTPADFARDIETISPLMNVGVIPAQGGTSATAYATEDNFAEPTIIYYYYLEEIEQTQGSTRNIVAGPQSATLKVGEDVGLPTPTTPTATTAANEPTATTAAPAAATSTPASQATATPVPAPQATATPALDTSDDDVDDTADSAENPQPTPVPVESQQADDAAKTDSAEPLEAATNSDAAPQPEPVAVAVVADTVAGTTNNTTAATAESDTNESAENANAAPAVIGSDADEGRTLPILDTEESESTSAENADSRQQTVLAAMAGLVFIGVVIATIVAIILIRKQRTV